MIGYFFGSDSSAHAGDSRSTSDYVITPGEAPFFLVFKEEKSSWII